MHINIGKQSNIMYCNTAWVKKTFTNEKLKNVFIFSFFKVN